MTTYKSALSPTFTKAKYINSPLIGLVVVVVEAVVVVVLVEVAVVVEVVDGLRPSQSPALKITMTIITADTDISMRGLVMMECPQAIKLSNSKLREKRF